MNRTVSRSADVAPSPDLLCFSHLRWDFVYQRPQHLLTRCAKERRVFFWEEPIFEDGIVSFLQVERKEERLWVIRPHLSDSTRGDAIQRDLLLEFCRQQSIAMPVLWYYTAMALSFSYEVPASSIVYDCMDELSAFLHAPPQLLEREAQLLRTADVVFTGGLRLFEAKRDRHANVHAFPSSIDREHFARDHSPEPLDQAALAYPRAGFYGVLDERFDFELLAGVALLQPETQFVLIGPVVKVDPACLPHAANIHYLGAKTYEELPAYLSRWDVALIPFSLNESTHFISPTKTPEYLAAGKPVVSTAIFDVVRGYGVEGLVTIANDVQSFSNAIEEALKPATEIWRQRVNEKLETTSWDKTWTAMWMEVSRTLRVPSVPSSLEESKKAEDGLKLPRRISSLRTNTFDYLVVGAGFAGSVLAERLATTMNKRVLLIDKRDHVGGNTFDYLDEAGILVHRYGPHIFHTNSAEVMNYLSQFSEWRPYEHRVLASVDGLLLPVPINLDTINGLYGLSLDAQGMEAFLNARVEIPATIRTSEDIVVSRIGRELYTKFFQGYTRKQWGLDPSQLDASVAGRIPIRFNHDDRYFADTFQAMPKDGYTRLFEKMLDHPYIEQALGIDYRDIRKIYPGIRTIFTGPVDEFFGYRYGRLPYRSLSFDHRTFAREQYQSAPVVNFPNDNDYTRVTEFKYLTGQKSPKTSVVFEYPKADGDPYYPIPRPENAAIYARYRELAERTDGVHFVGRLATYKYYNMDQVVAQALSTAKKIAAASLASEEEASISNRKPVSRTYSSETLVARRSAASVPSQ